MALSIPPQDFVKFTPVMQQYLNARHGLGDKTILFFRMGDFYETFFEDAELAAKELEITLTGRPESKYPGGRLPMAGVPAKAIEGYTAKLLERGYKVCIAEQMADPSTCKGIVPREIVKTFTPGTINELSLLSSYQNNFILALIKDPKSIKNSAPFVEAGQELSKPKAKQASYGLAYADVSTGEFYLTVVDEKLLPQELARINPSEIIMPSKKLAKQAGEIEAREAPVFTLNFQESSSVKLDTTFSNFDIKNFDFNLASDSLKKLFEVKSLEGFVGGANDEFKLGIQAAGAIIEYLKETQRSSFSLENFDVIRTYRVSEFMMLDANTRRNLELVKNINGNYDGSLMHAIDRTASNIGKRRLKSWIEQPLFDLQAIHGRQDSITELAEDSELRDQLFLLIDRIYDIERLATRLASESINPRELVSLKDSLLVTPEIASLVSNSKSSYLGKVKDIPVDVMDTIREIESALLDEPPVTITEGCIIREGFNSELDEYLGLVNDSQSWLKNFEATERERLGIKNLKVSFNKVHGYFIEVSKGNLKLVPEEYFCKQTMVNSSRFITPELKEFEEKITNAESRRNGLEHKLYVDLRKRLSEKSQTIKDLASNIANLDAVLSLARIAVEQNYIRPEINDSKSLYIKDGRHTVIEQKLAMGEFVPNDISLGAQIKQNESSPAIMILTGPNMAGKSTYMRQAALIILLAQIGSYVPASEAKIGLVDRIFTRIGASDDLSSGQSTFMVEMNETASILNGMTDRSFIVLDEIGRGTSTFDGLSIAWAVVEYIAKASQSRTIFATHYHELVDLEKLYNNIANYQMMVSETTNANGKNSIEFLHKVSPGSADRSYGIEVAKLAGLPNAVLSRARSINTQLQSKNNSLASRKKVNEAIHKALKDDGELDLTKLPLFESS